MNQVLTDSFVERSTNGQNIDDDGIEGLERENESWGDYPLDDLLIRTESRTIFEVIRRIEDDRYVMDPDFQRDFIWDESKQSKLIESVIMRIPLPVFYLAEDADGRTIVVDGLQRLSTFKRFVSNRLRLELKDRSELDGLHFDELSPKHQNRVDDCNLTMHIIDSTAPDRARLDIFERVNSGEPLTRQQMRNCLYMGKATRFLKTETQTDVFLRATGNSLNSKTMRDREFANRFCAFQILGFDDYQGDMDEFLASCLNKMNNMDESCLQQLSDQLHNTLANNLLLFGKHAFRKYASLDQEYRSVLNASLWDVMSTGLARFSTEHIQENSEKIRTAIGNLLEDEFFLAAITYSTNQTKCVKLRFELSQKAFMESLGDHPLVV